MKRIALVINVSDLTRYLATAAYVGAVAAAAGYQAKLAGQTLAKVASAAACGTLIGMMASDVFWDRFPEHPILTVVAGKGADKEAVRK